MLSRAIIIVFALTALAPADTIVLKNGRKILADSVREEGGRVHYTVGENTYAISQSAVDHIDTGGSPVVTQHEEISVSLPADAITGPADLEAKLYPDGKLDVDVLNSVEREGNAEKTAFAYFTAFHREANLGHFDAAERYIRRAGEIMPDNGILAANHASLLLRMGRPAEAVPEAERATRVAPTQPYAWNTLGAADFEAGRNKEAVAAWKKSLQLRDDPEVAAHLERAEADVEAESSFTEEGSAHFKLKFEGHSTPPALTRELLGVLEQHYNDLVRDLNYSPHENIQVLLYTNQAYFDVTRAPKWAGALFDGKLRIPIEGVTQINSDVSRSLKHELVHAFISQITHNRCPTWLNEGIAQLMEPASSSPDGRRLAQLFAARRQIHLNELDGSFAGFSEDEAMVAYAESLGAVEYIATTYGVSDLSRILTRIGEGQSTESAMRMTIHAGYAQLEDELTNYLGKIYGL